MVYLLYRSMRCRFHPAKSKTVLTKHGISLHQAAEIFDQVYIVDQKSDDPLQYRAIGWSRGDLYSVIYEVRSDSLGEYFHLITAWKSTAMEQQLYAENT